MVDRTSCSVVSMTRCRVLDSRKMIRARSGSWLSIVEKEIGEKAEEDEVKRARIAA